MLKVGIADDENIVRMGLKTFIDWEANGFHLIGLFNNGKDVINYCMTGHIDILITDIKMPVMDGIELIRNIKKILPEISIIVLSSYDDFPLVSNSYKEGISDYILKQFIEPENLLNILNTIKSRILQKTAYKNFNQTISGIVEKKMEFLGLLLFSRLTCEEELIAESEILDLKIKSSNLYCILLKLYSKENNHITLYNNIYHLASNICTIISETINRYCEMEYLLIDQNAIALILSFPTESSIQLIDMKLEDMANNISETLLSIFNVRVYLGCSANHGKLSELSIAYSEAAEVLDNCFFIPDSKTLYYNYLKSTDGMVIDEIKIGKNVRSALKYHDSEGLQNIVSGLFKIAAKGISIKQGSFKNLIVKIVDEIDSFIMESYNINIQQLIASNNHSPVQTILECTNIDLLNEYICNIIAKLVIQFDGIPNELPLITAAKEYINRNYMKNIRLLDISKHLRINSNYFCRLFKEKTGENLSHYIMRIRIEKSIELIEGTNFFTDEIAEKVGYLNTNYFIKIFKKITGKTISEFKGKGVAKML